LEKTFILVKPDGVQRGLMGEVIRRLEQRGLKMVAAKFQSVSKSLAEKHYAVHKGKPFWKAPMPLRQCGRRWVRPAQRKQHLDPFGTTLGSKWVGI
jgi:hypothetical protein